MQDVSTQSAAAPSPFFPDDLQFWYETKRVFGCASYGGSEFGEVLATVSCLTSGDYDSWYREWDAAGERVSNEAQRELERGHAVSARDGFLRAVRAPIQPVEIPYEDTTLHRRAFARIYDWLDETLG
jgi:hypothetical protein